MTGHTPPPKDADGELLRKSLEKDGFYDVLIHLHLQDHDGACFCTTEISGAYKRLLDVVEAHTAKAALDARDSEQNRLFSIMRALHIKHDATAIMKLRKEWDATADAEAAHRAALKQGPTNDK